VLHPLTPDVRLVETAGPAPLDPGLEAEVEAVWRTAVAESGGKLFNGVLYSLLAHSPDLVRIERSEYRRYIAGRRRPALAARLGLRPLGVTGFTRCRDGVVLGRRAARLELGGLWEPAPAGTLDRLDARALVLAEIGEELGLRPEQVSAATPRWLHEDRGGGFDLVYAVSLDVAADELRTAWSAGGTDEYADIAVVPWTAFRASAAREDFTALARALAAAA
jgi:hypothetical protein